MSAREIMMANEPIPGIDWREVELPSNPSSYTLPVAYLSSIGSYVMLGVGAGGAAMVTSTDGITWKRRTARLQVPTAIYNDLISTGTEVFSFSPQRINRSTNLSDWTSLISPHNLVNVCWNGVNFVGIEENSSFIRRIANPNADNQTWTQVNLSGASAFGNALLRVQAIGSTLWALGEQSGIFRSLDNGVNWTPVHRSNRSLGDFVVLPGGPGGANGTAFLVGTERSTYSGDLTNWSSASYLTPNTFNSIASDGTLYVYVGQTGAIRTTTNPFQINQSHSNRDTGTNDWQKIIWGNSRFVAVGSGGNYVTSTNGTTWSLASVGLGTGITFTSIVWNGSQFVTVGTSGAIATSPDGVTWTGRTSGTTNAFRDIAWGNSRFIAVGDNATVRSSTDGITWSAVTTPFTGATVARTIAYSGNQFVIVASSGQTAFSSDGITWTSGQLVPGAATGFAMRVVSHNGVFAAAEAGAWGISSTTSSGTAWTHRHLGGLQLRSIAYSPTLNRYVAMSASPRFGYMTSTDGTNWVPVLQSNMNPSGGFVLSIRDVIWTGTHFVAVGGGPAGLANIMISSDGLSWTHTTSTLATTSTPVLALFTRVLQGQSEIIALESRGVARCTNLSATTPFVTTQDAMTVAGMAYSPSLQLYVAVGSKTIGPASSSLIRTSPDGVVWTTIFRTPTFTGFNAVTWANGQFVVVGNGGVIFTSPDGTTWTQRTSGVTTNVASIVYGAGLYVAGAAPILTSSDGITWTQRTTPYSSRFTTSGCLLTWSGTKFTGSVLTAGLIESADGITWKTVGPASIRSSIYVASLGLYYAVGNSSTCWTSTNGTNWELVSTNLAAGSQNIGLVWTGSLFVVSGILANNTGYIATSPDFTNWTTRQTASSGFGKIASNPSGPMYVCLSSATGTYSSPDGITWTLRSGAATGFRDVAWTGSQFVAVGGAATIRTSPDGITWTGRTSGISIGINITSVAARSDRIIATTNAVSPAGLSSSDGITWTTFNLPGSHTAADSAVFHIDNVFIVSKTQAAGTNTVWRSDGVNAFTAVSSLSANRLAHLYSIVGSSPTRYVSIPNDGSTLSFVAQSSTDNMLTWSLASPMRVDSESSLSFSFSLGRGYMLTNSANLSFSVNGTEWESPTALLSTTTTLYGRGVVTPGGYLVRTGSSSNTFIASQDKVSWSAAQRVISGTINSILWDGSRYLAAGTTTAISP